MVLFCDKKEELSTLFYVGETEKIVGEKYVLFFYSQLCVKIRKKHGKR